MTKRFMTLATVSLCLLSAAFSSSAQAATFTIYTDRSAFLAAAGQVSKEDFNTGKAENEFFVNTSISATGFKLTDVRTPTTGLFSKIGATPVNGQTVDGTRFVETFGVSGTDRDSALVLTFDKPLRAFGADFVSGASNNLQLIIGGQSFTKASFTPGFFGVIADGDFNDIAITAPLNNGTFVGFDNVLYGSSIAGVPEPATWAMMISGFGLIGGMARRRSTRELAGA